MTIFLSRRPNLDPEPWAYEAAPGKIHHRAALPGKSPLWHHWPRREFEPTRDPHPWVDDAGRYSTENAYWSGLPRRFAPRRDKYDTLVNPILARFRQDIRERGEHPFWGDTWDSYMDWLDHARATDRACRDQGITDDHINHARRVLTRLANMTMKED